MSSQTMSAAHGVQWSAGESNHSSVMGTCDLSPQARKIAVLALAFEVVFLAVMAAWVIPGFYAYQNCL